MSSEFGFGKVVDGSFDDVLDKVTATLADEGFGVLSDIDVAAKMKEKLDKDMPRYRILGACNPHLAYQALEHENKIGTMLPCNVIVQDAEDDQVEVAAVDPVASMQAIENPDLRDVASTAQAKLKRAIESL